MSVVHEYSRVPNKREGGENNRGSWTWFDITIIGGRGVAIIGEIECLEKLKIVAFLRKHVSFIYLCEPKKSDVTDTFIFELWFC